MPTTRAELLQGTLDMLILRTLALAPLHGHGIAKNIQRTSDDVLQIEHGSLYPALHRLHRQGWIAAQWQPSPSGREMKFYSLTPDGRAQLTLAESRWIKLARAIAQVMRPA